ncbi:MAG: hypothetical protein HN353_11975 [Bdellovibrionales bacterium]|jgi:U32 family peptidase|nr:hypothetical protein [Bdellovibrionales bacterium]MBT3527495.1 hypothetical protein [Bdellovibrionales bacterium]MBT7669749.1 hypothetical protein [Bdellovibrionales bacterium]MBT7765526.1 hypothetical protein [Bdellovibrionales bacterium]
MQLTSYAHSIEEIDQLATVGVGEIILSYGPLSRGGGLDLATVNLLAQYACQRELAVSLEWDILVTEQQFAESCQQFAQLPLELFVGIRVSDFGVMQFIYQQHPSLKLIPILEGSCHNLPAILSVLELLAGRVKRVVLSIEISSGELEQIIPEIDLPVELLLLGPIPLYYSPRQLLTPLIKQERSCGELIQLFATSQEGPHHGFPLVESDHGTLIYNTRHLWLLNALPRLEQMGLTVGRVDLRAVKDHQQKGGMWQEIAALFNQFEESKAINLKDAYPFNTIHGFFRANKSDVLFPKLKNHRLTPIGENYLGEVVDVIKGELLAVVWRRNGFLPPLESSLYLLTPEGKKINFRLKWCRDTQNEPIETPIQKDEIVLINPIKRVSVKSQLYLSCQPGE